MAGEDENMTRDYSPAEPTENELTFQLSKGGEEKKAKNKVILQKFMILEKLCQ